MAKKYLNLYVFIHVLGDLFILNFSYLAAHAVLFQLGNEAHFATFFERLADEKYFQLWIFINLIYLLSAQISGTFNMYRNTRFSQLLDAIIKLFFFQVVLVFSYIAIFKFWDSYKLSRGVIATMYAFAFLATTTWRFGLIRLIRYYRSRGLNTRKVIIVGAGDEGREMRRILENKAEYGLKFAGYFDDYPMLYPEMRNEIIGSVDDAKNYAIDNEIQEMFCALPYNHEEQIRDLIRFADENLIRLRIVPDFSRIMNTQLARVNIDNYGMMPVLTIREEPLESVFNRAVKRVFDFVFTLLISALVLSWVIPLISLIIKLTSKGPMFFTQERSGERNEIFKVYKFRTMYVNEDAHERQAEKDDPRITPIGRFLRKTNLDELPQFYNVLLGHMSVIGPRPHMLKHTEEYSKIIDKFMVRHLVKPGITGWAQVNGYRGETKDPELMNQRVRHDVWYIENWSFFLDIRIVLLTIFNMIKGDEKAF